MKYIIVESPTVSLPLALISIFFLATATPQAAESRQRQTNELLRAGNPVKPSGARVVTTDGKDSAETTILPDEVKAIIGEAGGESFDAQVAVGEVIRRRGSLKGIYGVNNPVVKKASAKTIARAQAAWRKSATSDLTHGCKYFGGDGLDNAYFAKLKKPVFVKIGRVNFYQ